MPALAAFAIFPTLLLKIAFGPDIASGDEVLLPLGVAFALLACTYIAVQFLLGLHRRLFVAWLLIVSLLEPVLLLRRRHAGHVRLARADRPGRRSGGRGGDGAARPAGSARRSEPVL